VCLPSVARRIVRPTQGSRRMREQHFLGLSHRAKTFPPSFNGPHGRRPTRLITAGILALSGRTSALIEHTTNPLVEIVTHRVVSCKELLQSTSTTVRCSSVARRLLPHDSMYTSALFASVHVGFPHLDLQLPLGSCALVIQLAVLRELRALVVYGMPAALSGSRTTKKI
jgi:hypothetical protein